MHDDANLSACSESKSGPRQQLKKTIIRFTAERVQSLGKDWHRPCLRCSNEKCNKTLAPGSHSEHEGMPYCTQCYSAKFGPKGYGHGGTESHTFHGEQAGEK
uniref:Cysteine-rich protein 1 n=1 Tax=Ascaris lumbricoides TaxID=6252 RepID=A0A9J2Q2C1_ASCLU